MTEAIEITESALVDRYRTISSERMRGLPIVNDRLEVESVGFRDFEGRRIGILITPWFMNLVLLPGTRDHSEAAQGTTVAWPLPAGSYEFTACCDEELGLYFTAILFRTVVDIPDQLTARAIAEEILQELFRVQEEAGPDPDARTMSRRALFSGHGVS